ncbi:MAG: UDP-N-acetylenolpyruvoylglucosamine reductase [bacterium ADurb.Bin363]|nr:MAG: UDP-N-acetylenolpyruvoylglucosamine reductase [bacterium ADurb.Bin363]
MNIYDEFINNFNGEILKKESLSCHTSFKIGGPADLMVLARSTEEIIKALRLSIDLVIPFFILGGGTNIVFSDEGFRGVVIKILSSGYRVKDEMAFVESGVSTFSFAKKMAVRGLKGLEALGGLPGTIGGAIVGNAGAYGSSIGDVLSEAKLFLLNEKKIIHVKRDFFDFKYRYSRLKDRSIKAVILSAELLLKRGDPEELITIMEEDRHKRRTLHPTEPSAGCIFKNIVVSEDLKKYIEKRFPEEKLIVHNKLPAGKLIDLMGLKGKSFGDAMVSPLHGNYIINIGKATCREVKELIQLIKEKIRKEFHIELEEEVFFVKKV